MVGGWLLVPCCQRISFPWVSSTCLLVETTSKSELNEFNKLHPVNALGWSANASNCSGDVRIMLG